MGWLVDKRRKSSYSKADGVLGRDTRVLIDEGLVTRVEDDYDRWRADPRYSEWMNNEYMRAVVFPYGVARK